MGLWWQRRGLMLGLALGSTLGTVACSDDGEPSAPCPAILAWAPDASGPPRSTLLVTADKAGHVDLVRRCSESAGCEGGIERVQLEIDPPEQIMLSGDGRHLLYTRAGTAGAGGRALWLLPVPQGDEDPRSLPAESVATEGGRVELIGSLRSGDWAIFRDEAGLHAVRPDAGSGMPQSLDLGDGVGADLRVVALGDQHIVARELLDARDHVLYLIDVKPEGQTRRLARGNFTRVLISRSQTLDADDPAPPGPAVDAFVVATAGQGAGAESVVFDVEGGEMIDRFPGTVRTSPLPLEDIPGLDAVSPDGRHLAYVTPAGSVALRDLQAGGACVAIPEIAGQAGVTGFGADGTLYAELSASQRSVDRVRVFAHDLARRRSTALGDPDRHHNLRAVPPRPAHDAEGRTRYWAVGARGGLIAAAEGGVTRALGTAADAVHFLSASDEEGGLYLVESAAEPGAPLGTGNRDLRLRRLRSGFEADPPMAPTTDPAPYLEAQIPYVRQLGAADRVCMATPRPGSWSTRCATPRDTTTYLRALGLPESER